jgi:2-hydroxychromene-2-carboxylate isomerase
MSAPLEITYFTDPGCPLDFANQPQMRQVEWHYGDQLRLTPRVVVLSSSFEEHAARGTTPAKVASMYQRARDRSGMPIDASVRDRLHVTRPACTAVVATRLHAAESTSQLLRAVRVRAMGGGFLDDPDLIADAARASGIDPQALAGWMEDGEVRASVATDMDAARSPLPAAMVLDHKLAAWQGGRRYASPSLVIHASTGDVAVPGTQTLDSIEVALANADPTLRRAPAATSVEQILLWATYPLATVEVAALIGLNVDEARAELSRSGAEFEAVANDGYWSLAESVSVA